VNIKTLSVSAAMMTAAFTGPVLAQYERVPEPGYYRPHHVYGPVYGPRTFRGAYNYDLVPMGFLFYGDGWVPESIWDPSRVGGVDPTIRPSN
jgi:hypothetical protein